MRWDLIIYENMTESGPCTRSTVDTQAVGGSAYAIVQLAEGLAARGKRVLVLTRGSPEEEAAGVTYKPAGHRIDDPCEVLLISRKSRPTYYEADRVFISATDVGWGGTHVRGLPIIACSEWHRRTFLPADYPDVRVIPSMIDDDAYAHNPTRDGNLYVYASASRKGLEPTLEAWASLAHRTQDARLLVTTPGYDPVDRYMVRDAGAVYHGDLPPRRLQEQLRAAAGLFYVNTYAETFCVVAALAEASGARAHVLCLNDPGALPEVIAGPWLTSDPDTFAQGFLEAHAHGAQNTAQHDFRASKGISAWGKTLWG